MVNTNSINVKFLNLTPNAYFYACGKVVHGFGRGSKQLGVPTANLEECVVDQLLPSIGNGIYSGWAKLPNFPVFKMVMSIGWNPFFKNEIHVLHEFDADFYDEWLEVIAIKYQRPERDFRCIDDLIKQIHSDIADADQFLEQTEAQVWRQSSLFLSLCDDNQMIPNSK